MKKIKLISVTLVVLLIGGAALATEVTKEQVVSLVDKVAGEVKADAPGTFKKIIAGEHPYKNKDNPSFYVFVYNTDVVIVAHPKADLVGRSYKGKPDVRGKKFRDEIVQKGLSEGAGWVDYSYQKPGESGIHAKTTYLKKVKGSDGKVYIVCSGKYK